MDLGRHTVSVISRGPLQDLFYSRIEVIRSDMNLESSRTNGGQCPVSMKKDVWLNFGVEGPQTVKRGKRDD